MSHVISVFSGRVGRPMEGLNKSCMHFVRSRDVAMATNFRCKLGEIAISTFICSSGILKRIRILERRECVNTAYNWPMS